MTGFREGKRARGGMVGEDQKHLASETLLISLSSKYSACQSSIVWGVMFRAPIPVNFSLSQCWRRVWPVSLSDLSTNIRIFVS
jgi:hypothetical protein